MSTPSAADALAEQVRRFGTVAYLVTVGPDELLHVVSTRVDWHGERLAVPVGRTSAANAQRHPAVTLLWPAPPGEGYSLIVDGRALSPPACTEPVVEIEPTRAVLHRTPEGDPSAPSCIRLLPAS